MLANDIFIYSDKNSDNILLPIDTISKLNDWQLFDKMGLQFIKFDPSIEEDKDNFIAIIREKVAAGLLVYTPVDLYVRKGVGEWNIHYQKDHFTHDLLVIGYDDLACEFHVLDTNDKYCFETQIPYSELYESYLSYLVHCPYTDRKVMAIKKKDLIHADCFDLSMNKDIWLCHLWQNKKIMNNNLSFIKDIYYYSIKGMVQSETMSQNMLRSLYTNHFFSINLKMVQQYQIKTFLPDAINLQNSIGHIILTFNVLKSLLMKFSLTQNSLIISNVQKNLDKLYEYEKECYHLLFTYIEIGKT